MEKAGTIAQHLNNGSTTQAGRKPKIQDEDEIKKINSIFEIFALNYNFWMHNKDVRAAKMLWLNKLHNVGPKSAASATDKALTAYPDKPPTVGQFLQLCRVEPAHQPFRKMLPPPDTDGSAAQKAIAQMKLLTGAK